MHMSSATGSFVWYELMTNDVAAAKSFYSKVIGWSTQDVPISDMTYTLVSIGDRQIGGMMTMPKDVAAGMKPAWMAHVGVDNVDTAVAKLQQLEGKVHRPPTDIPNVGRFAVVADRQGAGFLMFKPAQADTRTASMAPGNIGWHELHTNNWPNAFEFYSAMFGWTKGDAVDMGPMGTYQLFMIGGSPAGGMFNSPAAKSSCFWLYYFIVDDIDAADKRVSENGGKITQVPQQVPGGGWILQAVDPQGAAFALTGPRK
jgi:predicted enzyme related to lactoylglutathione lyase